VNKKRAFEVTVIGSGPGGYVSAIKAAQLGAKVALIEASELGGTCLNRGCIPTKALIANAQILNKVKRAHEFGINITGFSFDYQKMKQRKNSVVDQIRKSLKSLIQSNQITIIPGYATLNSTHEIRIQLKNKTELIKSEHIILATGSEPKTMPAFPFDGKKIHNSTSILEITQLPKKIAIVGAGYIGCEFASLFSEFDVEVILLEATDRIIPLECTQSAQALQSEYNRRGIETLFNVRVQKIDTSSQGVKLYLENQDKPINADIALVSIGRSLNTSGLGLETAGVYVDESGFIPTNNQMQTNIDGIYAVGDITAKWLLAHVASHQGIIAASNACGRYATIHYNAVPAVVFTNPEIASVGYTLEQAKEKGFQAYLGQFPFQALGKAQASADENGFAQVVVEKSSGRILGAQVVCHEASSLIAEMALAIQNELTIECISNTIHAHPTLSEAWMEAALNVYDQTLHLPPKKR
jgi:dihydrolipoamide dehydrogenase